MEHNTDASLGFYFSGDFITTFYLNHRDFIEAKNSFLDNVCDDFEDLIILHSALRAGCQTFMTNDKLLVEMKKLDILSIEKR